MFFLADVFLSFDSARLTAKVGIDAVALPTLPLPTQSAITSSQRGFLEDSVFLLRLFLGFRFALLILLLRVLMVLVMLLLVVLMVAVVVMVAVLLMVAVVLLLVVLTVTVVLLLALLVVLVVMVLEVLGALEVLEVLEVLQVMVVVASVVLSKWMCHQDSPQELEEIPPLVESSLRVNCIELEQDVTPECPHSLMELPPNVLAHHDADLIDQALDWS